MDLVSWTLGNYDYDQAKPIYIDADDPNRSISANQARHIVRKLVAGLIADGIQPGDCVCVYAFNDILYPILLLGIVGAGAQYTGCNPAYTTAELNHHISITHARFLITEVELLRKVNQLGSVLSNVYVLNHPDSPSDRDESYKPFADLMSHGEADWISLHSIEEAKATTAALLSTSGTTGLPKAAMYSHHSWIMLNRVMNDSKEKPYEISRLISIPMFHMYAFPLANIAPLREGIPTHVMARFDLMRYLASINRYKVTETPMLPAMINLILKDSFLDRSLLRSLRLVWSAGTSLDKGTQDQISRLLDPLARVIQIWGMTEAGYNTTFLWPESDHTGSVGRLLPGVESKLLTEDGIIINEDHIHGEILIKGPLIMQGYLGNSEATNEAFDTDGWLRTGDIGYTAGGKYYIVGRKKEMIKVRGWQVSPAELESVLMRHNEVLDCAVLGTAAADISGEAPRAYVVKKPGSLLDATTIKTFMSTYLAGYKSPSGGVVFVDTIPKNAMGKILRRKLKEQAEVEAKEETKVGGGEKRVQ